METKNSVKLSAKKIMGLFGLIIFSLAFIFACMKKILPVGRVLFATFGIMVYPLSIIFAFISLASFLGFSYARRTKPTVYMIITLSSILLVIHSIDTFKALDTVATAKTLGEYISLPFVSNASSLLGSVGNMIAGLVSLLLGGMGTIVVFVIITTIFGGLFIDYQFYGKYQEEHIKKLKTRRIREKVYTSDKNQTEDSKPNYSFSKEDVAHEISVSANEYESQFKSEEYDKPYYTDEDVAHEITDIQITEYQESPNYRGNFYDDYTETQTKNEFSTNVYEAEDYPNIYTPDMNDYHSKREFINATFGRTTEEQPSETYSETTQSFDSQPNTSFGLQLDDDENDSQTSYSSFGLNFDNETQTENSEISKILNSSEDDEENDVKTDIFGSSEPLNSGFNMSYSQIEEPKRQSFEEQKPIYEPKSVSRNDGFGSMYQKPAEPPVVQQQPQTSSVGNFDLSSRNNGFGSNLQNQSSGFGKQNVVVPAKEQKPSNNYGVNIGMTGIRYNPPPLSLLATPKKDTGDYTAEQARKTAQLENVLQAFNINAKVVNIVRGPKITRFELSVPLGTSVKKIPQYEDDIAAALAAKTITIRAPIPGSPFVGIELENDTFSTVYQRELFESDVFQNFKDPLPIAIGKDISGEIVVKSLADMTHLLIAGSTGSGKSVFIHNIVLSLIYKSSPEDVKLIMIDPKRVEFNRYNGLPHLVTPEVVMGSQKAISALKWCVKEMDRRYELMSKAGFNNIKPYNKSELVKAGQFEKFPYIVIIVDELAEIMQANKKEAEACIQRITQLARACGMHMVLATQRPSVDIITGVIKNNIPSRVAFSLQSGIDSKTILNTIGAEKLLGRGDMLFSPTGTSSMPRLQASYASDEEIQKIIDYVKHNNVANYDESVEMAINAEQSSDESAGAGFTGGAGLPSSKDTVDGYFKTAVGLVMKNGGASVSYLQRRLSIGYSRAARIVDQMEERGYIAAATGSKVRKVLITPEQFREEFGEDLDSIE